MCSLITALCVLFATLSVTKADDYYKIFEDAWPHCANVRCESLDDPYWFGIECDTEDTCFGFSVSNAGPPYSGCLKMDSDSCIDDTDAFGDDTHDFYIRDSANEGSTGYVTVFDDKVPVCSKISSGSYSGVTKTEMMENCNAMNKCIGFSWDESTGTGRLKKDEGSCGGKDEIASSSSAFIGRTMSALEPPAFAYYKIFSGSWMHCSNINCVTLDSVDDFATACDEETSCFGFSVSIAGPPHSGCLKTDVTSCVSSDDAFGSGTHDFYVRDAYNEGSTGYVTVFTDQWPDCANIQSYSGVTETTMMGYCDAASDCIGFSWNWASGGYLKKDGGACAEVDVIQSGSYGYIAKVSGAESAGQSTGHGLPGVLATFEQGLQSNQYTMLLTGLAALLCACLVLTYINLWKHHRRHRKYVKVIMDSDVSDSECEKQELNAPRI